MCLSFNFASAMNIFPAEDATAIAKPPFVLHPERRRVLECHHDGLIFPPFSYGGHSRWVRDPQTPTMGDFWLGIASAQMPLPGPSLPMVGIGFYRLLAASPSLY